MWLFGHHSVSAALANPERRVLRVVATPDALEKLSAEPGIPKNTLQNVQRAERKEIDALVRAMDELWSQCALNRAELAG